MNLFKENNYYIHINACGWGVGKLLKCDDEYIEMYFSNIGYKTINRHNAETLLKELEPSEADKVFRKGKQVYSKNGKFKQQDPRLSKYKNYEDSISTNPDIEDEGSPLLDLSEHVPKGHMTKRFK